MMLTGTIHAGPFHRAAVRAVLNAEGVLWREHARGLGRSTFTLRCTKNDADRIIKALRAAGCPV